MVNPQSKIRNPKSEGGFELISGSVEETQDFGARVGRLLRPGDVVALYGVLGTGKTTFVQGLAQGLGRDPDTIKSPTFVLMREYPGAIPLIHVDGYRLEGGPAVSWLDLDLIFSPTKVTVIEWAERFSGVLPEAHLEVRLHHVSTNRRRLSFTPFGDRATEVVTQFQSAIRNPQSAISATKVADEPPGD